MRKLLFSALCFSFMAFAFMAFSPASAMAANAPLTEKSVGGLYMQACPSEAALAPDTEVEIHIMLTVKAPAIAPAKNRPSLNVALVIDRSGSMSDSGKLNYAIRAGKQVVDLLGSGDKLALIAYDDEVKILSPLTLIKDKEAFYKLLNGLEPGGYTFLSGGLEAGINQLKNSGSRGVNRVILLSDGLANRGITEAKAVGNMGASARDKGIIVSAMGLGLDYDENLMQHLAQRGGGQYSYIRDSEDLPGFFRQELALAAESATKDLRLRFVPGKGMKDIKVYGYTTAQDKEPGTLIEMGDMYSGEERQILIQATLTTGGVGSQELGMAQLSFSPVDSEEAQTIALPVLTAVVADEEARKTQNTLAEPTLKPVQESALLLAAEEAHVAAMGAMQRGDKTTAQAIMSGARASLAQAAQHNPAAANKMEALQVDEERLDDAMHNPELQKDMSKRSKGSFYMSSQGKNQALMLQKGDKGAMVEKLQRSLSELSLYSGPIDGVYSEELETAVRTYQKQNNLDADGIAGQRTMFSLGF